MCVPDDSQVALEFCISAPEPVATVPAGRLQVMVYATAEEMGRATALAIAREQVCLVQEKGETSLMLMAAPSAFPFYRAYIALARLSAQLQDAIRKTHFFQFDDYPLPAHHQASFRFLLCKHLFFELADWYDPARVHLFHPDLGDSEAACRDYAARILEHGPDLQVKGQGEDGHWGFHQPGTPLDGEPAMIRIEINEMNRAQQMRDHPTLFRRAEDVPQTAYTANVPLFMRAAMIEDNVPQASKAYAIVASYGNDAVCACCPSSALKDHPSAVARTTLDAAWALLEYRQKGILDAAAMTRLDEIWETPGDPEATALKRRFMRESFDELGIRYE